MSSVHLFDEKRLHLFGEYSPPRTASANRKAFLPEPTKKRFEAAMKTFDASGAHRRTMEIKSFRVDGARRTLSRAVNGNIAKASIRFQNQTLLECVNAREYSLISRENLCAFPLAPGNSSAKKKAPRAKKVAIKTQKPSEQKLEGRKKRTA